MAVGDIYFSYLVAAIIRDKINGLISEENNKKLVDFETLINILIEDLKIDGPIINKPENIIILNGDLVHYNSKEYKKRKEENI